MTDTVIIMLSILLGLNLYALEAMRRLHEKVNAIGDMQHMQFYHPEELLDDPCAGNEPERALTEDEYRERTAQLLDAFREALREGAERQENSQTIKEWDEGNN